VTDTDLPNDGSRETYCEWLTYWGTDECWHHRGHPHGHWNRHWSWSGDCHCRCRRQPRREQPDHRRRHRVQTEGPTGKYRDNLTTGATTPFTGGTGAGSNIDEGLPDAAVQCAAELLAEFGFPGAGGVERTRPQGNICRRGDAGGHRGCQIRAQVATLSCQIMGDRRTVGGPPCFEAA
jgi:hypothetical protein